MSDPLSFKAAFAEFCALACAGVVFVAAALEPPPAPAPAAEAAATSAPR